jgi:uncharacterized hydrophobic protein (TIGR00271 family)
MSILTLTAEARSAVIRDVTDDAVPRSSFYILVLLSTAIASYGLLANSTAVVIGAMLIAPLMGPIYGIALGLLREDRRLFFAAMLSEAIGIVLAVGLAFVIGSLPLRPDFGTEILARTRPNLYDLVVAIVAGVAGAYARSSERISPTLPGVAIATALVPPLAVCGLCLSDARWDAAFGAFLLFVTNLLAIEIAAAIVFALAGLTLMPATDGRTIAGLLRRFAIPVILLIPISAFLLQTLTVLVREDRLSRNLRRVIDEDLHAVIGADLSELHHERRGKELEVVAVILTPQSIEPALVSTTEADLKRRVEPDVHLIVRSLISRDADRDGQVFLDDQLRQRVRSERARQSFLTALSEGLRQGLARLPGAELVDVQREERDSSRVRATVRTPSVISPSQVSALQHAAAASTGAPIQLIVRSVLTTQANDRGFLNEDPQVVLREGVRDVITRTLAHDVPDADVLAVHLDGSDPVVVTATLVGSRLARTAIERLNHEVSKAIARPTTLKIQSIGSTSTVVR